MHNPTVNHSDTRTPNYTDESQLHYFCILMNNQRKSMGYSFRSLAAKIGNSSGSHFRDIEIARAFPSIELVLLISQVLDMPLHIGIDYVSYYKIQRVRKQVVDEYRQWLEYTPSSVVDSMLFDQESYDTHEFLINYKED